MNKNEIDYSKIEIILITEDDKIIDTVQCASNGFYMIPIYENKNYKLKVKDI